MRKEAATPVAMTIVTVAMTEATIDTNTIGITPMKWIAGAIAMDTMGPHNHPPPGDHLIIAKIATTAECVTLTMGVEPVGLDLATEAEAEWEEEQEGVGLRDIIQEVEVEVEEAITEGACN